MKGSRITVVAAALTLVVMQCACALRGNRGIGSADIDDRRSADAVMVDVAGDEADRLPGMSGAVGVGSRIVYARASGLSDIASRRTATPQTRYRIYSTSKSMGAVAAMVLAESGELDLDAPISTYLTDLPAHIGVITVRQLLAHRSGIRHYRDGEWDSVSDTNCAGPRDALADFINDPLEFAPGTDYGYSTFGYVLLSAVLEAASGQPFDEFVRTRLFDPAGMTATAIEGREIEGLDVATFYDRDEEGDFSPTVGINASCKFFGGGLVSTAEDMVRFGLALVNGRLVSRDALTQMLTVHSEGDGGSHPPYGYGFFPGDRVLTTLGVPEDDYVHAWWHGGNGRGGYSVLILYPEQHAAAAITTNVKATGRLVRATHSLALPFLRN